MSKIKLKHTNLLGFVSSSLFCLANDKKAETRIDTKILRTSLYTFRLWSQESLDWESRPDWRSVLCLCLGFASLNVPPWLLSKTFLYTLRTFQSNRILTMSIFSPFILNGYKRIKMYWKTLPHILKILQIYQGLVSIEINHFK